MDVWGCEDNLLRDLCPPLNAIRPGDTLNIAPLPWIEAQAYPVCMTEFISPLGGEETTTTTHDLLPPLPHNYNNVARASQALQVFADRARSGTYTPTRVALVLGRSFLVLSEIAPAFAGVAASVAAAAERLRQQAPHSGPSSTQVPPPTAATKIRARALSVFPLHFSFVSPAILPGAANIVDLRACVRASREGLQEGGAPESAAGGLAVAPSPILGGDTVPPSEASHHALCIRGSTLVFNSSDSTADLAAHVDLARGKVFKSTLSRLAQLAGVQQQQPQQQSNNQVDSSAQ